MTPVILIKNNMWLIFSFLLLFADFLTKITAQTIDYEITLTRAKKLTVDAKALVKTLKSLNRTDDASLIEREILAITELTNEIEIYILANQSISENDLKPLVESLIIREDLLQLLVRNLLALIPTTTTTTTSTTSPVPTTITTTTPTTTPPTTTTSTTPLPTTTTTTLKTTTTQQPIVEIPLNCSEINELKICECVIEEHHESYIVCNNVSIDDTAFAKLSRKLPNTLISYLSIEQTSITKIINDTFKYTKFKRIYIEKNSFLEIIETNAFKASSVTEVLVIRNNPKLIGNLFGVSRNLGEGLTQIIFNNNRISVIPTNGLSNFQNVKLIYMNSQTVALKTIASNAIHHLPSLTQLNLDSNQIDNLELNAINISDITAHNVIINLNNNQLNESTLTTNTIITNHNTLDVLLNLDNNAIKSVYGNDLFERFATSVKGIVYLRGNPIDCSCDEIVRQNWLKNGNIQHIWGLSDTVCKSSGKTIGQCLI